MVAIIIVFVLVILMAYWIISYRSVNSEYDKVSVRLDELREIDDILTKMEFIFNGLNNIDVTLMNADELVAYKDVISNTFNELHQHPEYNTPNEVCAFRHTLNWMRTRVCEMMPEERVNRRNVIIDDILN